MSQTLKRSYFYLLLIPLFFFFSCATDDIQTDVDQPTENPESQQTEGYLAFRIYNPGDTQTRDGSSNISFEKGEDYERALYFPDENNPETEEIYHFAILFDSNGNLASTSLLNLERWDKVDPPEEKENYITVLTKIYNSGSSENPFGKSFNGTVYVVVNASHDLVEDVKSNMIGLTLTTLQEIILEPSSSNNPDFDNFLYLKDEKGNYIVDDDGNKYFTMTSSIIVNEGKTATTPAISGLPLVISPDKDSAVTHTIDIFVERLQSKFDLVFKVDDKLLRLTNGEENKTQGWVNHLFMIPPSGNKIKYVASYEKSDNIYNRKEVPVKETENWKVNIVGWGINALEPTEYLFKNIAADDYGLTWADDYSNRFIWAADPKYLDERKYPDQYRKASDIQDYESTKDNSLIYKSFNDLSKKDLFVYTPENTFDVKKYGDNPIGSKEYLRTGSHLIVTAQLLIDGFDFDEVYKGNYTEADFDSKGLIKINNGEVNRREVRNKYLMNGLYWEETAYIDYVSEYLGYWMLTKENEAIFGKTDGYFYSTKTGTKADAGCFTIEEANIKGGDAMVWVNIAPDVTLYTYNPESQDDNKYTKLDRNKYKNLMFEHQNYLAQRLLNGRMYYSWGSEHNLNSTTLHKSAISPGDYGTVRNNWYSFTVNSITAPGTPVSVPEQLIIPNNEPVVNGMGVSMKLIDWHNQNVSVDVSGQRPKQ